MLCKVLKYVWLTTVLLEDIGVAEQVDLFGSGKDEWHLAFRATANTNRSVYDAFVYGYETEDAEEGCKQTTANLSCSSHYRSSIVRNWTSTIDEVALTIYKDMKIEKYLIFDGNDTNFLSWFLPEKLKCSSWRDLKVRGRAVQYFSITGDYPADRIFFINNNYCSCPSDAGWFVVLDKPNRACQWEQQGDTYPVFKYSDTDGLESWQFGKTGTADMIAIHVRYKEVAQQPPLDLFGSGKEEWHLAFRATANIQKSVYHAFVNRDEQEGVEEGCKQTTKNQPCSSHYRSSIVHNWKSTIDEVALAIYKHMTIVKYLIFDGSNTTYLNWFRPEKLKSSSWPDLKGRKSFMSRFLFVYNLFH